MSVTFYEVDFKSIPKQATRKHLRREGVVLSAVQRFMDSGIECALAVDEENFFANSNNFRRSLCNVIKAYGFKCEAFIRENEVYIRRLHE